MSHIMSVCTKTTQHTCDIVPDWPCNFTVAKRNDNFRHFDSHTELSLHLALDWNERNQQFIHGNLPDITLLLIGYKLATH